MAYLGFKHAQSTKDLIGAKKQGTKQTPENIAKIKAILETPEMKAKCHEAKMIGMHTPEAFENMSKAQTGRFKKPEELAKVSRQNKPANKTIVLSNIVLSALEDLGGKEWLVAQAKNHPVAFMGLLGRLLPIQMQAEIAMGNKNGVVIKMIERVIVDSPVVEERILN